MKLMLVVLLGWFCLKKSAVLMTKKPQCNKQQDADNKETKQKNSDLNMKLEICLCEAGSSSEDKIGKP